MNPEQPQFNPEATDLPLPVVEHMADDPVQQPDSIISETQHAMQEASQKAAEFIERNAEVISLLVGIRGLNIRVGDGWATNLETREVTVDPSFFVKEGYKPEWAAYGTLHELVAHLKEIITEPALTKEVIAFARRGKAYSLFHNIVADVAGNKDMHRRLPVMAQVGAHVYSEKLFPEDDYTQEPRHLQLLNAMIRDEMIPGSQTTVLPEVSEALGSLRDFRDTGQDAIKAATDPARKPRERFELAVGALLPVYLRLLQEDKQDPRFQAESQPGGGQPGQPGEGEAGDPGEEGEGQQGGRSEPGQPSQGTGETKPGRPDFSKYYDEIEAKHPEPFTPSEQRKIRREAERAKEQDKPAVRAEKALEKQTGHSIQEIGDYRAELSSYAEEIQQMQQFFEAIISRRLQMIRRLGRPSQEGVILDPSLVAQTHVDVRSGITDPATFLDYERKPHMEQAAGSYDLYLVVDTSGSMKDGNKSKMAATSAMIFTEGLDLFEKRIKEVEESEHVRLELDVATQVMTFGSETRTLKGLSPTLTEKQRLDTHSEVIAADGGSTADYLALEEIARDYEARQAVNPELFNRKRIVVVETDGGSDDPASARAAIERLRNLGFRVIGIGIQDNNAEGLYAPDGRTIAAPNQLPSTLINIIETEIG